MSPLSFDNGWTDRNADCCVKTVDVKLRYGYKFGELLSSNHWDLVADFRRDPRSSDSLRGSRHFFSVMRITHDFTDFSSEDFFNDIWTQQFLSLSPCKLSEQNFESFTVRVVFFKTQKLLTKFPGLATLRHHNSATIIDVGNSLPNGHPTECLVFNFTVSINSNFSPGLYAAHRAHPKLFRDFRNYESHI